MIKTRFVLAVSLVAFMAVGVAHADIAATSYYKAGSNISINDGTISATVPTVNNATLTIQKNGTSVGTFTANASSNKTINITVPTGSLASKSAVESDDITDGTIVDVDISSSAAIDQSKIANLTTDLAAKEATANKLTSTATTTITDSNKDVLYPTYAKTDAMITSKIQTLDVTDSAQSGKYVSAVSETDGKISVSRASLPTIYNTTLTIKNGATSSNLGTFTANASASKTITIPAATATTAGLAKIGVIPSGSDKSGTAEIWVQ